MDNKKSMSRPPFWMPWGVGGCLWRTLLFLLGMVLLSLLMALLLRGCNNDGSDDGQDDSPLEKIEKLIGDKQEDPYKDLPEELRDTSIVKEWRDSIPGVEELPAPDDNFIPPVDSSRVIVNPEDSTSQIVGDQLVVFFNSKDLKKDMAAFAQRFKQLYPGKGYEVIYYNPTAGTMLLQVPQDKLIQVAQELPQKITDIDFRVATNEIMEDSQAKGRPSDPDFAVAAYDQYFKLIQAYDAWGITKGSKDVRVAIVDSYFDLSNSEIGQRYVDRISIPTKSQNVLPPSRKPRNMDEAGAFSHGSHVAGLAIGAQNNKLGCSGIAPECSWIPISLGTQLTSFNIMEGILYAIYHGADVVNFSLGRAFPQGVSKVPLKDQISVATQTGKMGEQLWEYIVKVANDHNCVLCTSAGNDLVLMGMDPKNRSSHMIKVEATDGKGMMATDFSNFGKAPEAGINYSTVSAPGVGMWSVSPKHAIPVMVDFYKKNGVNLPHNTKSGFVVMQGTSMAAPVVAGAVALLKSKKKDLTSEQVIKILTMTAKQFDKQHRIGPCIQLKDALDATGGELANFDDLMKNHQLLVGKWKSTHELQIGQEGKKTDDIWTYFIFTSPTAGTVEHHCINLKRVYRVGVSVKWESDRIVITQQGEATDGQGNNLNRDDYVCRPDKNRLLEATCIQRGKSAYNFQLEKVK